MNNGSRKSKDKYLQEKVDTFVLRVPKGEKNKIKEYAATLGKSLNSYILDLIAEDMPSFSRNVTKSDNASASVTAKTIRRSSLPDFLD